MSAAGRTHEPSLPPPSDAEGSPRLEWVTVKSLRTSLAELRGGRRPQHRRPPRRRRVHHPDPHEEHLPQAHNQHPRRINPPRLREIDTP